MCGVEEREKSQFFLSSLNVLQTYVRAYPSDWSNLTCLAMSNSRLAIDSICCLFQEQSANDCSHGLLYPSYCTNLPARSFTFQTFFFFFLSIVFSPNFFFHPLEGRFKRRIQNVFMMAGAIAVAALRARVIGCFLEFHQHIHLKKERETLMEAMMHGESQAQKTHGPEPHGGPISSPPRETENTFRLWLAAPAPRLFLPRMTYNGKP